MERGPDGDRATDPTTDDAGVDPRPRRAIVCDACEREITDERARTEMSGAHRHTFVNPHGIVFEIGVFSEARGVAGVGDRSEFFSWFPGYAWRTVVCRGCGVHLGWSFGEGDFFGLILDRLRAEDS